MRIESSKGERASNQEAENDLSRRSRLAKILNVANFLEAKYLSARM